MFDGVPDQFHQFITPRTSSLPLHLPFPLHASATPNSFPTFDPYNHPPHQLPLQIQPNLLHHPLHHHPSTPHNDEEKEENSTASMNLEIERDHQRQQLPELIDPWTNDELLALLKIRSSMDSWFPDFTWEHVSRKLAEVGYKRSAEKCKEKFEEESRYFNNVNNNYSKNNYRFVSELEELYQGDTQKPDHHQVVGTEKPNEEGQDKMGHALMEEDSRNVDESVSKQNEQSDNNKEKKRKRADRFEAFKGFCESVVHKMMAQQEEMHKKLLQDMLRRDEEKFTREEAWKKQEMEKMNKELEIMAREQAIAGDRQANIIEFLKKFSASSLSTQSFGDGDGNDELKVAHCSNPDTRIAHSQNPTPLSGDNSLQPTPSSAVILNTGTPSSALPTASCAVAAENPSSSLAQDTLQVPPSSTSAAVPVNPSSSLNSQSNPLQTSSVSNLVSTTHEKDDIGRRWPKDEVLALINLRCNSLNNNNNNNNNNEDKEGNKAPLWERISQGMLELGYKRSAKRCKEKWENINKYFRKTKDANKKRSLDSRTCPYFHLLSNLYKKGKIVLQAERQEESHLNAPPNPEQAPPDQTQLAESSQVGPDGGFTVRQVHHGGEKTLMQVPSLDFDQF